MYVKEYKTSKTVAKTLNENNLIQGSKDKYSNVLLDLSLLDELILTDNEKQIIVNACTKQVRPYEKEVFYIDSIDIFTSINGVTHFNKHSVYNEAGKRLYTIMELKEINHNLGTRKSVYDQYYDIVNQTVNSNTYPPLNDIEVA